MTPPGGSEAPCRQTPCIAHTEPSQASSAHLPHASVVAGALRAPLRPFCRQGEGSGGEALPKPEREPVRTLHPHEDPLWPAAWPGTKLQVPQDPVADGDAHCGDGGPGAGSTLTSPKPAGAPRRRGLPSPLSPQLSPTPAGSCPDGGGRWVGRGEFLVKARLQRGTSRREGPPSPPAA